MKLLSFVKFSLVVATVFILLAFAEVGHAQEKYAVLIGVGDYVRDTIPKLSYTKKGALALRDELIKVGFKPEKVFTLTCGASQSKDLATKQNIELVIAGVLSQAKEGDLVLIYMAGHGQELNGQALFCPLDTKLSDISGSTVSITKIF